MWPPWTATGRSRTPDVDQRHENLNQANKLARAFVMLLGALQRHHGKVEKRDLPCVLPSDSARTGRAETAAPAAAADETSEKQPQAKPVAPASVPPVPDPVPAKAASVSAPVVGPDARRAQPAGAGAKTEKQPHAQATAPAVKAAELAAEVERLQQMVDDALARRRKSEE